MIKQGGDINPAGKVKRAKNNLIEYGNQITTSPNGTRVLKNAGFDLQADGLVHSGQGLHWSGTQSVDTGIILDLSADFTLLYTMERQVAQFGSIEPGAKAHFGFSSASIVAGVGANFITLATALAIGSIGTIAVRYRQATGVVTVERLGSDEVATFNVGAYTQPTKPMFLGKINGGSSTCIGVKNGVHLIPKYLKGYELAQHFQNPHLTVYRENNTLRSAFLPTSTLALMAVDKGFSFTMTENENAQGAITDTSKALLDSNVNSDFEDGEVGFILASSWSISEGQAVSTPTDIWRPLQPYVSLNSGDTYLVILDVATIQGIMKIDVLGVGLISTIAKAGMHYKMFSGSDGGKVRLGRNVGNSASAIINSFKVYNLTNPASERKQVANFATSNMRGNAANLSVGAQACGYEQDQFGLLKSPNRKDELVADGKSYIDLQNKKIQGDFYIDLFADVNDTATIHNARIIACSPLDNTSTLVGGMYIYIDTANKKIKLRYGSHYRSLASIKDIFSLDVVGGTMIARDSSGAQQPASTTIDYVLLQEALRNVAGRFAIYINKGTRTDAERDLTRLKLKAKHGVI